MQIVIDIPAEDFEKVKCGRGAVSMMRKAIIHGTPLPKGHGRLIDADELANKTFYSVTSAPYITYKKFVDAPTVIEAEE